MTNERRLNLLQVLPIIDLQQLLTFANSSRSGKRHELIERCAQILKSTPVDHTPFRDKIDELYNKRFEQGDMVTIPYSRDQNQTRLHNQIGSNTSAGQIDRDIRFSKFTFNEDLCQVSPCIQILPTNQLQQSSSHSTKQTHVSFYFILNVQQASDVSTSTYFNTDSQRLEYRKQILLRFTTVEKGYTGEQPDKLPPNLYVLVNGRVVTLPLPKPTSKPNADVVRPGRPIDITEYCRLCPLISNLVEISWFGQDTSQSYGTFVAVVFITQRMTVNNLISRLNKQSTRDASDTQRQIIQTLQVGSDDPEVASTSLRLPLECPTIRVRMKMPGRATSCKHVHCFDIDAYLKMNEKRPTWLCPVCNKPALYQDLFVDQFFVDIIEQCPIQAKWIEYDVNGQWKPICEEKKTRGGGGISKSGMDTSKHTNGTTKMNGGDKTVELCECTSNSQSDNDDDTNGRIKSTDVSSHSKQHQQPQDIPLIELDDD
ncbi:unnamed protein product [Didymodactylos carnosus]|uniref:Uncharacterized protein n=2 Tax=Didymodactylos carnosus TaxID=1234261 RepID=A0A815C1S3_9BILA|nr:unnamed protein product [Didymodactylos carnosus]CAF4076393.1 unnamed protein product [Didymodactylos carnosus]